MVDEEGQAAADAAPPAMGKQLSQSSRAGLVVADEDARDWVAEVVCLAVYVDV